LSALFWHTGLGWVFFAKNGVSLAWTETPLMVGIAEAAADILHMCWEGGRKAVNGLLGN